MAKKFIEQKKKILNSTRMQKKASTKNYQAANSMHVLFRRRVKMIFYTNIFLSRLIHQTPNCFGREESRKKHNKRSLVRKKYLCIQFIF